MPTETELKNELFQLREKILKKEEEIKELRAKMARVEKELGMAQPILAAPIPDINFSTEAPAPPPATSSAQPAISPPAAAKSTRPGAIQQKIPTSGTSQMKARETQFECPGCGSHYNAEIDDKNKILYVVAGGTRIYGKKHRCMNCGNEWAA